MFYLFVKIHNNGYSNLNNNVNVRDVRENSNKNFIKKLYILLAVSSIQSVFIKMAAQ